MLSEKSFGTIGLVAEEAEQVIKKTGPKKGVGLPEKDFWFFSKEQKRVLPVLKESSRRFGANCYGEILSAF